jgi:hypothetical protein
LKAKIKSPATSARLGKARAVWFVKATEKSTAAFDNANPLPPFFIEVSDKYVV